MTQEALKLALDFVETVHVGEWVGSIERQLEVITAIKEALAQTQEPVKMVAYNCFCGRTMKFESVHGVVAPQRTWVDLTRTQMQDVYFEVLKEHRGGHQMEGQLAFGEALQAKIKEKNT